MKRTKLIWITLFILVLLVSLVFAAEEYQLKKIPKDAVETTTIMNGMEVTYMDYDNIIDNEDVNNGTEVIRCKHMLQTLTSKVEGIMNSKDFKKDLVELKMDDKITTTTVVDEVKSKDKVTVLKDKYELSIQPTYTFKGKFIYNATEIELCENQLHTMGVYYATLVRG